MSKQLENQYEEMASFFNERAEGYEDHMKKTVVSFENTMSWFQNQLKKPIWQ